ncbi:hypothetical protein cypCar_00024924 [Cyprinus carpio]|nr:hypothetical protein cypCar_00024924 [Cyprinus carpio]
MKGQCSCGVLPIQTLRCGTAGDGEGSSCLKVRTRVWRSMSHSSPR